MTNQRVDCEDHPVVVRTTVVSKMKIALLVLFMCFGESCAQVTLHNLGNDASQPRLLGHVAQNVEGDDQASLKNPAYYTPKCPKGFYDSTCGRARWFACAGGCPGGAFGDSRCMCACQWGEPKICEESTQTSSTTTYTATDPRTSGIEGGDGTTATSTTTPTPTTTRLANDTSASTTLNVTTDESTSVTREVMTATSTTSKTFVESARAASEDTYTTTSTASLRGSIEKAQSLHGQNALHEHDVPSTSKIPLYTAEQYFSYASTEQDGASDVGSKRTPAERSISPQIIPWLLIGGFMFAACCGIACLLVYVHKIRQGQAENTVLIVSPKQTHLQSLDNSVRADLTLQKAVSAGDRNAQFHQFDAQALPSALVTEEWSFYPGDFVTLQGLAAAHLNGKFGRISGFNAKTGRFDVKLVATDEMKAVRPCNLIKHFSFPEKEACPKCGESCVSSGLQLCRCTSMPSTYQATMARPCFDYAASSLNKGTAGVREFVPPLSSHSSDSSSSTRMPSPDPSVLDGQS